MKSPSDLKNDYQFWEITKDLIDQCIDVTLNLSQSGHPGGSRSKVHGMLITLLSGAMRWDIRDPTKRFSCLLYTSPSPRDVEESRMPSSA